MQKKNNRFTAVSGENLGSVAPTSAQKKSAKKVAAYLRALSDEEKACSIPVSH
jgi:hypothetical protein